MASIIEIMRFSLRQILLLVALFGLVFSAIAMFRERISVQFSDHTVISISPDGKQIATGTSTLPIQVWDTQSHRRIARLRGHTRMVQGVVFTDIGKLVSVSFDNSIRFWDLEAPDQSRVIDAGQGGIGSLGQSPDRKIVATGGFDGSIKLWDVTTKSEIAKLVGLTSRVTRLAFSPDQKWLASIDYNGSVCVWDIEQRRIVWCHTMATAALAYGDIAFSPDGILAIACHHLAKLELREVPSGNLLGQLQGPERKNYSAVTFSPDGRTVALGHSGQISIHDWQTKQKLRTFPAHGMWVENLSFTSDGKHLVSGSRDNSLMLWNVVNGRRAATLQTGNDAFFWEMLTYVTTGMVGWILCWWYVSRGRPIRQQDHEPDPRSLQTLRQQI